MSTDARTPTSLGMRLSVITLRMLAAVAVAAYLFVLTPVEQAVADSYPPSSGPTSGTVPTAPPTDPSRLLRGTIDNAEPVAGSSVTVVGQGFAAGEVIAIALRSSKTSLGQAVAGQDGTASLTFTVPASLRGTQNIVLTGLTSGRVASIGTTFIAPPGAISDDATSAAVAIVGLGGLGVVLLTGGVALLAVGRRHALAHPGLVTE